MDSVHWLLDEGGWQFNEEFKDSLHGSQYLKEIYVKADPQYNARVTVPVLWDKKTRTIGKVKNSTKLAQKNQSVICFALES